jgi:NADH-quinone oxidoreductase subunit E
MSNTGSAPFGQGGPAHTAVHPSGHRRVQPDRSAAPPAARLLSDRVLAEIRACFPRYPTKRAVLLPALHVVNEHLGYVPPSAVVELAELLELAPAEVQDTLSFYGLFRQDAPAGQYRVWVCRSISCAACGGEGLLEYLCERLGIRPGQTTDDGRVTLEFAECLGACDYAPAVLVNNTLHPNMTREKIDELVKQWAVNSC